MNQIFNESCFDTMNRPELQGQVDIVITSPPYNTSRVGASDKYSSRYDIFQDFKTDQEYIDWTCEVFNHYDKILKPNGCVLYNISYSSEKTHLIWLVIADIIRRTNFITADCIVWKKSNAIPNNVSKNKLTRIVEYIFVFSRKSEFKTFDTTKQLNGNPIILSTIAIANNIIYNASDSFYSVNVASNFLSTGYIEFELECPNASSNIDFITNSPLRNFYITLVIIDIDPELTKDLTLAPPVDYNTYNINMPIRNY